MERRKFLKTTTTLISASPLLQLDQLNLMKKNFSFNDEVVRMNVGKFNCTIFRDMMFKYLAKDFFINANPDELAQSLQKYHLAPDNIPSPFVSILLQNTDRRILIDTGIGYAEKPIVFRGNSLMFQGRLHQLLQQEKVNKEDITDVIITHLHPDHIGGIFSEDGKLNFPNAKFYMHEDEWNYWHSSGADNQSPMFKLFIEKNITKLKEHNLHLVRGEDEEIIPGITAIQTDGHTPGQIAVMVHSERDHLLYISDAFLHPLHIERLDWQTNYDLDHEKARRSRTRLLEMAHKENMLVNAFHFDFPGLGRVNKFQNNWTWNYTRI